MIGAALGALLLAARIALGAEFGNLPVVDVLATVRGEWLKQEAIRDRADVVGKENIRPFDMPPENDLSLGSIRLKAILSTESDGTVAAGRASGNYRIGHFDFVVWFCEILTIRNVSVKIVNGYPPGIFTSPGPSEISEVCKDRKRDILPVWTKIIDDIAPVGYNKSFELLPCVRLSLIGN